MITKTVGKLRNLIKFRREIISCIRNSVNGDNVLLLSLKDNRFSVTGHTDSSAMNLYLLGRGLAMTHAKAKEEYPDLNTNDFLTQPIAVAMKEIEAETVN